jgi:ribonucleoside-triphosphate reductase
MAITERALTPLLPETRTEAPDTAQPGLDDHTIRAFLAGEIDHRQIPAPQWGPIGQEVFERTYARPVATALTGDDGQPILRKESWAETVRRVVNGSLSYLDRSHWVPDEDIELFRLFYAFKALPAGRHLWVTGTTSAHMSKNCWVSGFSARTSDHFSYAAARLFEGGGVGGNYSADLRKPTQPILGTIGLQFTCIDLHPDVTEIRTAAGSAWSPSAWAATEWAVAHPEAAPGVETIRVEDTREGWVDTWVRLIDLSTTDGHHPVMIDVSDIRPHGAVLKTFGGTASGPSPLVAAIVGVVEVLNQAATQRRRIGGLESMQMDHEIAASVVAGGARRSARMSIMSWRDPEIFDFISCKADQMHHWSTNISVEIDEDFHDALAAGDPHAEAVLEAVVAGMVANGEPGFVDTHAHSADEPDAIRITNPCGEASLNFDPTDAAGESCNLGSVDLAAFGSDHHGALRAFSLMARFLYRATLNPHHQEAPRRIETHNRRIGVGIMGLQGWVAAHGAKLSSLADRADLLDHLTAFRSAARTSADHLASGLGLPRPVKVTAVAPTGSIAQMRGTTPSINAVMAKYFIRRVRYTDTDPSLVTLEAEGHTVVDDIYAANTKCVEFVVRDGILDHYPAGLIEQSDEISAKQFFSVIAAVQQSFCGWGDGQAVSATAQIPSDMDPSELVAAMRPYLGKVKGLTVFPNISRDLSPYETLTETEYNARTLAGPVMSAGDSNSGECVGGACPVR